jgi:hypothetical protein
VIKLSDGLPQAVSFQDEMDASKYLVMNIPAGNSTVAFQVRSKTPGFYPKLFVSSNQSLGDQAIFPPSELLDFDVFERWDQDLYSLRASKSFSVSEPSIIALNLLYHSEGEDPAHSGGEAVITASQSLITKLQEGEDFRGELLPAKGSSYRL